MQVTFTISVGIASDYWQKAAVLADDAELLKKIKAKLRRY